MLVAHTLFDTDSRQMEQAAGEKDEQQQVALEPLSFSSSLSSSSGDKSQGKSILKEGRFLPYIHI